VYLEQVLVREKVSLAECVKVVTNMIPVQEKGWCLAPHGDWFWEFRMTERCSLIACIEVVRLAVVGTMGGPDSHLALHVGLRIQMRWRSSSRWRCGRCMEGAVEGVTRTGYA
jgi:hypothetical protein